MTDLKLGIALWSQASDWPSFLAAAQAAERLGYDHVWTWDHIQAIFGDPDQPIFEGYTALAAVAQATERVGIGLFVGANTFRNPGLAVKCLTTIDHISGGRAIIRPGRCLVRARAHVVRDRLRERFRTATRLAGRGDGRRPHPSRWRRGDQSGAADATPSTTCGPCRGPFRPIFR